jgi:hypothetical protein
VWVVGSPRTNAIEGFWHMQPRAAWGEAGRLFPDKLFEPFNRFRKRH